MNVKVVQVSPHSFQLKNSKGIHMTKEEKIAAIVEANLESMDLKDLERYYIDTQVFEYETYASGAEIDEEYDRVTDY